MFLKITIQTIYKFYNLYSDFEMYLKSTIQTIYRFYNLLKKE